MNNFALRLGAYAAGRLDGSPERGQATVEYVGLVMVLGTGIGMIVAGLDALGFVAKVGGKIVHGITSALGKIG
jgi:hypothetical protein